MTVKEMECVFSAIWHAKETIENLACENYPYTEFVDSDFCKMFYTLNEMNIAISKKIEVAKAAQNRKGNT